MQAKTNTEPKIVYRFFNAENGNCITGSEARKLPPDAVIVEALRVPSKKSSVPKAQKHFPQNYPSPALNEVSQPVSINARMENMFTRFISRLKRAFIISPGNKKEQPLFEVNESFR
ncbi:MAG: hypothetical protein KF862_13690 [Chitinophagaceae bacterium]|nr:hypothetical protein [Chitinophagaceae bacterium]